MSLIEKKKNCSEATELLTGFNSDFTDSGYSQVVGQSSVSIMSAKESIFRYSRKHSNFN